MRRAWAVLLIAGALGCAHSGTQVRRDDSTDFSSLHAIGVPPFTDPKGQGALIAQDINDGLQKALYDPVDLKALDQIFADFKPGRSSTIDLETIENIRRNTSANAVVLGRMAPDWSAAVIIMFETETGQPILRAVLKPRGRHKAAFTDAADVAQEALRVITGQE